MPNVPVKFYVKHEDGSSVTEEQEITLKMGGAVAYEFQTDDNGYVQKFISTAQYVAYTNDGCPEDISIKRRTTITLQNSCAT